VLAGLAATLDALVRSLRKMRERGSHYLLRSLFFSPVEFIPSAQFILLLI